MLDVLLLEEVIPNIENWSYGDLKEISLLSEDEIKGIATNVESEDYCDSDIISLCATALHYLRNQRSIMLGENGFSIKSPNKTSITYETTGVDKSIPVTCSDEDYEFKRCMR